ncbi:unnamed protein product, partial [Rotaria sordida]
MPRNLKVIVSRDLDRCKCRLIIHDLDLTTRESDVKKIIAGTLGTNKIKFDVRLEETEFIHGRQSQCATVRLPNEGLVNEIMAKRPIRLHNKEVSISRQIPRNCYLCHQITYGLKVQISSSNGNLTENEKIDLENYFRRYGKVNYCEYVGNKAYFIFNDYDTVDRIALEKDCHQYKGRRLLVEKIRLPNGRITIPTSDIPEYCIHVNNMPTDVTSEDLSSIFKVNIANILVRPHNELNDRLVESDRRQVEAWIKEIPTEQLALRLAKEKTGFNLRGFQIHCQATQAPVNPFDLCGRFQTGKCPFSIGCDQKHIRCVEPIKCKNTHCWYGHDKARRTRPARRPTSTEDGYRIRVSNFPPNVTRSEIFRRLQVRFTRIGRDLILCNEEPNSTQPIIAYIIDRKSELIARQLIHCWHNEMFSSEQEYRIKCQLEVNVEYFNSNIGIPLSLIPQTRNQTPSISSSTNSMQMRRSQAIPDLRKRCTQWKTINDDDQQSDPKSEQEFDLSELPSPWCGENAELLEEKTNEMSKVFSIVDQTDSNKTADIRIYSTGMSNRTSRLRLQRHRLALERLKELDGIPKLIDCNYETLKNSLDCLTPLWMITEPISDVSLDSFVSDNNPDFQESMIIILKLINLIKQIHQHGVVHRNLTPNKIFIDNFTSTDVNQFHLKLIDFDLAHIDQKDINKTNENGFYSIDNPTENDFYQIPQFQVEPLNNNDIDEENQLILPDRQSKNIDASSICAILFWMITLSEPKVSRDLNGKAPHQISEYNRMIEDTLQEIAGDSPEKLQALRQHLMLIFDRGFEKAKGQWPIEELEYQIRFIIELITTTKNQEQTFQSSSSAMIPMNPFIRLVSLIQKMKDEFVNYYSRFGSIHWSDDENDD